MAKRIFFLSSDKTHFKVHSRGHVSQNSAIRFKNHSFAAQKIIFNQAPELNKIIIYLKI